MQATLTLKRNRRASTRHSKTADVLKTVPEEWQLWCLLCAKNEPDPGCVMMTTNALDKTVTGAIQKYFKIQITNEERLSNVLCMECVFLVKTLVRFTKHVAKVQKMFHDFQNKSIDKSSISEMHAIRIKYGLLDVHKKHTLVHSQLSKVYDEEKLIEKENDSSTPAIINPLELFPIEMQKSPPSESVNVEVENSLENNCNTDELTFDGDRNDDDDDDENMKEDFVDALLMPAKIDNSLEELENSLGNLEEIDYKRNPNERKLRRSSNEKNVNNDKALCCTECSRQFKSARGLVYHRFRKHPKQFPKMEARCPQCSRVFKTRYSLRVHSLVHLSEEEKKTVPCPHCGKKFSTKSALDVHIKHMHLKERRFVCEKCGVAMRSSASLKEHMLSHTDYAPCECEVCGKHFKDKYRLKKHMQRHDTTKYTCDECGLQVNSRSSLKNHALVHSDEMKYKCDYCGRRFKRPKTLRNHLILHTDLQPYSCNFCDRTFANGSNCRWHKKKEHPKELAELEASGAGKTYTHHIPKLDVLKMIVKVAAAQIDKNQSEPVVNKSEIVDDEENNCNSTN